MTNRQPGPWDRAAPNPQLGGGSITAPQAAAPIRPSVNALILTAAVVGLGWSLTRPQVASVPLTFAFIAAAWLLSVVVHEFGHAWVAWLGGDHSVASRGYLTLDPLKYTDIQTSLIIPLVVLALGGIGFPGGAVYLRPDLMRSAAWRSLASLAGPAGTLVVLIVVVGLFSVIAGGSLGETALMPALGCLAFLQASALVLNLLPIPGLDGFGVLKPLLPEKLQQAVRPVEAIVGLLLLGLILLVPGFSGVIFGLAVALTDMLGVPREQIADGFAAFRFWQTK